MPAKPVNKKSIKKKKTVSKKSGPARLAIIVLAIIISLAFVLFSIQKPGSKRTQNQRPIASVNAAPEFRLDGQVQILTDKGAVKVDVEVADEENERMQGLMYRYSMEENQGMYFIFPEEDFRSFWMKNTFMSLDIIFINANHEIVSIQKYAQPKSTYSQPSEKPAKYVLEVNAGFTDKHGIKPGDRVKF